MAGILTFGYSINTYIPLDIQISFDDLYTIVPPVCAISGKLLLSFTVHGFVPEGVQAVSANLRIPGKKNLIGGGVYAQVAH